MGCGGSTEKGKIIHHRERQKSLAYKSSSAALDGYEQPKEPSIFAQAKVKIPSTSSRFGPRVIFIFGGPGSKKGRLVEDLVNCYDMRVLVAEDLILSELPRRLRAADITTTQQLAQVLKDDPSHLDLKWVLLDVVSARLEAEPDRVFLLDIVPNLLFLLKCNKLTNNCEQVLRKFEEVHPCAFALNLAITEDRVVKNAKLQNGGGQTISQLNGSSGGDEIDSSRTKRRLRLYRESVEPFLDYFRGQEQTVSLDVSCSLPRLVWHSAHQFFTHSMHMQPRRVVNTVLVFAFEEGDFSGLNFADYRLNHVTMATLVEDPKAPPEELLAWLCAHIDSLASRAHAFAVNTAGTSLHRLVPNQLNKRVISFLEMKSVYLHQYVSTQAGSGSGSPPGHVSLFPKQYKAISSTDNEVCLFLPGVDRKLCRGIAVTMATNRHL